MQNNYRSDNPASRNTFNKENHNDIKFSTHSNFNIIDQQNFDFNQYRNDEADRKPSAFTQHDKKAIVDELFDGSSVMVKRVDSNIFNFGNEVKNEERPFEDDRFGLLDSYEPEIVQNNPQIGKIELSQKPKYGNINFDNMVQGNQDIVRDHEFKFEIRDDKESLQGETPREHQSPDLQRSDYINNPYPINNQHISPNQSPNKLKEMNFNTNVSPPKKPNFTELGEFDFGNKFDNQNNANDVRKFNTSANIGAQHFNKSNNNFDHLIAQNKNVDFDQIMNNINMNAKSERENIYKDNESEVFEINKFASHKNNSLDFMSSRSLNFNNRNFSSSDPNMRGRGLNLKFAPDTEVSYGKPKLTNENKESINERKSQVIEDNVFSSNKQAHQHWPEQQKKLTRYLQVDQEVLDYQIQIIFEDMLSSFDVNNIKSELENFHLHEQYNQSPIGPLSDLKTMMLVTGLEHAGHQFAAIEGEIVNWRMILGDGNCFYRAFMFSALEAFILNSQVYEIKKTLLDINANIDMTLPRKNVHINKNEINGIFYIILDALENGSIKTAYEVLIKSYHKFTSFDYVTKIF